MLGPVEDGVPGRDRRRVRDDRLLAVQRLLRAGALQRAAGQQPRHVEPDGVPRARRLRLRGLAVQLHRHRRQPDDRAGADGQHGRLEAGLDRDAERLLHAAGARGGRHAAGRDQLPARRRRCRSPDCCSTRPISPACTSPAAPRSSTACGRRSARTSASTAAIRGWSAKPAARTSSSRTRRRIRRRWRSRSCAAASNTRGRSARRRAASTCRESLWNEVRDRTIAMMKDIKMGDVRDFRNFMGAVIDKKAFAKISGYLDDAKKNAKSAAGRRRRRATTGYFIEPTLVQTEDPGYRTAVRGDLRTGRDRLRLSRRASGRTRSPSSIGRRRTR